MEAKTIHGKVRLQEWPDKCPHCHRSITPISLYAYYSQNTMEILMACPDSKCGKSFIAYYHANNAYADVAHFKYLTSFGTLIPAQFKDSISNVSPLFCAIYNEAFSAEQMRLFEICGVGYRKSLEFLIKDYAKILYPDKKENIETASLGNVIENFVNDPKIKSVAKRAVWLGNDETHYVRKWEEKDLTDLKKLIDLTVHWIEMETLTKQLESEMPEPKK